MLQKDILKKTIHTALLAASISVSGLNAMAQQVQEPQRTPAEWSTAYSPFRIAGNLYYVGTYDLACYLITTPEGHILINTGLSGSAGKIRANIEQLGFRFRDIKILSVTQAHYDHMGAMAEIKKSTGAKLFINAKDAAVVKDGGKSDYAMGGRVSTFQPLQPDRLLHNGDQIKLGGTTLTMLHHPGHTKGSCSFIFDTQDDKRSYKVLIANFPTIVTEKPFAEVKSYPQITADYAYTLRVMKDLKFDIWVASHASQFKLQARHHPGDAYNPLAFADQKAYDTAISELQDAYQKKLSGQ